MRYELSEPLVFMRPERDELLASGEKVPRRIFAVGYQAKYIDGEIALGKISEYLKISFYKFLLKKCLELF